MLEFIQNNIFIIFIGIAVLYIGYDLYKSKKDMNREKMNLPHAKARGIKA